MADHIYGGQAVIEGVMMRDASHYSIAVRTPNGQIAVKKRKIDSPVMKHKVLRWPFVRGVVNMFETLVLGMEALSYSANMAADEDEKFSAKELAFTFLFAIAMAVGLFILLPLFLTSLISKNSGIIFNLIDGLVRLAIFLLYLFLISLIPDIKVLFQYHGAEHKVINAFEHKEKLVPKKVEKYSVQHTRCGTSFFLIVMIISIVVFSVITSPSWLVKMLTRILLIPVIIGISYEVLKLSSRYHDKPIMRIILVPGLFLQRFTTRKPNIKQVEVAIAAFNSLSLSKESKT